MIEPYACPNCQGTGDNPDQPWRPCGWCFGNRVMYRTITPPVTPAPPRDEPPSRPVDAPADCA
jgi:hypothetical protein